MLYYPHSQRMDWPFRLGHLLVPQLCYAPCGAVARCQQGWSHTLCQCHQLSQHDSLCPGADGQAAMPTPSESGTAKQGLGARAAPLSVWLAVSSLTATSRESLAFHIPEPLCCASSACAVRVLGDENQGICIFAAMDQYQLLSHSSLKFSSLYFENSTQR